MSRAAEVGTESQQRTVQLITRLYLVARVIPQQLHGSKENDDKFTDIMMIIPNENVCSWNATFPATIV